MFNHANAIALNTTIWSHRQNTNTHNIVSCTRCANNKYAHHNHQINNITLVARAAWRSAHACTLSKMLSNRARSRGNNRTPAPQTITMLFRAGTAMQLSRTGAPHLVDLYSSDMRPASRVLVSACVCVCGYGRYVLEAGANKPQCSGSFHLTTTMSTG